MIKKRLTNTSDEDSDNDESLRVRPAKARRKRLNKQTILSKILNRSSTGYFNGSFDSKSNQWAFSQPVLKFCLKDIIPFRYLNDHIFMGLSSCGNFLISYKRICCETEGSVSYDFNSGYKYELFFWIYRPHMALSRYYTVNLFDDHGAEDIKCVTMTQWSSDQRTLIVHGSSEIDDQHSFVSIVKVPTLGCLGCMQLRDADNETSDHLFKNYDLCMKCNLTIHTKYRFSESTQKFEPNIHLNAPDFIIMCENSLIHTINVQLDMQKTKNHGSSVLNHKYLKRSSCDATSKVEVGQDQNNVVNNNKSPPDDAAPKKISIVEQILADFSEYDVECPSPAPSTAKLLVPDVMHNGCEKLKALSVESTSQSRVTSSGRESSVGGSSLVKPPSPQSPELLEAAAKTYEFSEENEKCEKISIFRKRRLADKKYEFNEENTENIIPFNRTRSRTMRRPIYQHKTSPHPSFRSPCGSPVANRCIMSPPPGFRSPSYYAYRSSPTHHPLYSPTRQMMRLSGSMSPAGAVEDVHKYFSDIMNRMKDNRVESGNESCHEDSKATSKDSPTFSKKIVNYYVEEDDANSVVTCEEDDCISPGYHLSLPMEVHGACYSKLQIVSKASLSRLKGFPRAIVTQNSFDIETFSIHIANKLCTKNNKKYGILFDLAFEIVHVCPLSQTVLCVLILQFTGSDFDRLTHCFNCSNDSDCFAHRKLFESTILFTWKICGNDWKVLDYGQLKQLSGQMRLTHPIRGNRQEMLIKKLQRFIKKIFGKDRSEFGNSDHLRVLDSNEDKSKQSLVDAKNGIEFYRRQPFDSPSTVSSLSSNSSASASSDSDPESCDEQQ